MGSPRRHWRGLFWMAVLVIPWVFVIVLLAHVCEADAALPLAEVREAPTR